MNSHTKKDLQKWQALSLPLKITMTEQRIRAWISEFGIDGVYVSFSGGKDSTVLLDIVRNRMGYNEIPAVFVDTGLEYPEIREFVKTFDNVVWLKPKMNFKQVIEEYGYPFISKEVAHKFHDRTVSHKNGIESYVDRQLNGTYISKNGKKNQISIEKYKYLTEAPFKISHKCCDIMKKAPTKKYEKENHRKPMIAQMASESALRTQLWLKYGCNAFGAKRQISNPMMFWTEQDVLEYIYTYHIPICSVYGEIVPDLDIPGQMSFSESTVPLKTTGCNRTG